MFQAVDDTCHLVNARSHAKRLLHISALGSQGLYLEFGTVMPTSELSNKYRIFLQKYARECKAKI